MNKIWLNVFPRQASDIVGELLRRIYLLEDSPGLGRMIPEYEMRRIRELVDAHNRVLYWLRAGEIQILTIVPTRSPLPPLEPLG